MNTFFNPYFSKAKFLVSVFLTTLVGITSAFAQQTELFNADFENYAIGENIIGKDGWFGTYDWPGHVSNDPQGNFLTIGSNPKDSSVTTTQVPYIGAVISPQTASASLITTTFEASIGISTRPTGLSTKSEYYILQFYNGDGKQLLELWLNPRNRSLSYKSSSFETSSPPLTPTGFILPVHQYSKLKVVFNMRDNKFNFFVGNQNILRDIVIDDSQTIDRSLSYFSFLWFDSNPSIQSKKVLEVAQVNVTETTSEGTAPTTTDLNTQSLTVGRPINEVVTYTDLDGDNMTLNVTKKPSWLTVTSFLRILKDRTSQLEITLRGTIPANSTPQDDNAIEYEVSDGINTVTATYDISLLYPPTFDPVLSGSPQYIDEEFAVDFIVRDRDSANVNVLALGNPVEIGGRYRLADEYPKNVPTDGYAFSKEYRYLVTLTNKWGTSLFVEASDGESAVYQSPYYSGVYRPEIIDATEHAPKSVDSEDWNYPVTFVFKFKHVLSIDETKSVIPSYFEMETEVSSETGLLTVTLTADPSADGFVAPELGIEEIKIVAVGAAGEIEAATSLTISYNGMAPFYDRENPSEFAGVVGPNLVPVTVSPFAISTTELSFAQFELIKAFNENNGLGYVLGFALESDTWESGNSGSSPLFGISWRQAIVICNAWSEMQGLTPVYYKDEAHTETVKTLEEVGSMTLAMVKWDANGYRLPTETEWEIAARSTLGNDAIYPITDSTNTLTDAVARFGWDHSAEEDADPNPNEDKAKSSATVGSFASNPSGMKDMAGNVREWVFDSGGNLAEFEGLKDPVALEGDSRVFKGGGWGSIASACTITYRGTYLAWHTSISLGLRVARSIPTQASAEPAEATFVTSSAASLPKLRMNNTGSDLNAEPSTSGGIANGNSQMRQLSAAAFSAKYAPFTQTVRVSFNLSTPSKNTNTFAWVINGLFADAYASNTMTGTFEADLDIYFNPVTGEAVPVAIKFANGSMNMGSLAFDLDYQADGTASGLTGSLVNVGVDTALAENGKILPQQIAFGLKGGNLNSLGRNGITSYNANRNFATEPVNLVSQLDTDVIVTSSSSNTFSVNLRIPLSSQFNLMNDPFVPVNITGQIVANGSFDNLSDVMEVPLHLSVNQQGAFVLSLTSVLPDVNYQVFWSLDYTEWFAGPIVQGSQFPWTDTGLQTTPLSGSSRFYKVIAVPLTK